MQQNNSTDKTASEHKTGEIMVYKHPFFLVKFTCLFKMVKVGFVD